MPNDKRCSSGFQMDCGNCGMRLVELILAPKDALMVEVNAYDQLMVGVMSTSTLEVTCIPGESRKKGTTQRV
jgi:hypothetical protein